MHVVDRRLIYTLRLLLTNVSSLVQTSVLINFLGFKK